MKNSQIIGHQLASRCEGLIVEFFR